MHTGGGPVKVLPAGGVAFEHEMTAAVDQRADRHHHRRGGLRGGRGGGLRCGWDRRWWKGQRHVGGEGCVEERKQQCQLKRSLQGVHLWGLDVWFRAKLRFDARGIARCAESEKSPTAEPWAFQVESSLKKTTALPWDVGRGDVGRQNLLNFPVEPTPSTS